MKIIEFSGFRLNTETLSLSSEGGRNVKIKPQPARLLAHLASRPGELVTREEIRDLVWKDRHAEFDQGINTCIRQIRSALGDDAENPRFIETQPRRGYRFVAPVEVFDEARPPRWKTITAAAVGFAVLLIGSLTLGTRGDSIPVAERKLVAIMPAEPAADLQHFSRSMAEDLASELTYSSDNQIAVLATASTRRAMLRNPTPMIAAQNLGADFLITTDVQREGELAIYEIGLRRVADGMMVWADSMAFVSGSTSGHAQAVRERIAPRVVEAIVPGISHRSGSRRTLLASTPARSYYLRGAYLLQSPAMGDSERAVNFFERAIEADSSFGRSYAGLAHALFEAGASVDSARSMALRAIELAPAEWEGYLALAQIEFVGRRDFAAADSLFDHALRKGPGSARVHHGYAAFSSAIGRHDRAIAHMERAIELDPISPILNVDVGMAYFAARDFDRALAQCEKAVLLDPTLPSTPACFVRVLMRMGRPEDAMPYMEQFLQTSGVEVPTYRGDQRATEILHDMIGLWLEKSDVSNLERSYFHAAMGNFDEAIAALTRAIDMDERWVVFFATDPRFDAMRGRQDFISLIDRLGLPPEAVSPRPQASTVR